MKTKTLALVVLMAAFCSTAFAQVNGILPQPPDQIVVTGNAEVDAAPDIATVRLGVLHQSTSAKDAQDQANRTGLAILKAIGALGVPSQQIQTSRLTIMPVYSQQRPNNNDAPRIVGYSASNMISVTLENLSQIGPVVDAGLDNGANQLEGVRFGLKNDGPAREMALRQAVAEAQSKAAAMASALSIRLGTPLEVSESGVSIVPFEQDGVNSPRLLVAAQAISPTPVSTGQMTVHASVMIRYRINQ